MVSRGKLQRPDRKEGIIEILLPLHGIIVGRGQWWVCSDAQEEVQEDRALESPQQPDRPEHSVCGRQSLREGGEWERILDCLLPGREAFKILTRGTCTLLRYATCNTNMILYAGCVCDLWLVLTFSQRVYYTVLHWEWETCTLPFHSMVDSTGTHGLNISF